MRRDGLSVVTVAEWEGIRVDNGNLCARAAQGIVIHHTAGANRIAGATPEEETRRASEVARAVQTYHITGKKTRWRDMGYHFLISRGGLIMEGRNGSFSASVGGRVVLGAHANDNEVNGTRYGVCLEGTYSMARPTVAAWDAMVELCAWLSYWGNTQSSAIEGHMVYRATECPGSAMAARLPELRAQVKAAKLTIMQDYGTPLGGSGEE